MNRVSVKVLGEDAHESPGKMLVDAGSRTVAIEVNHAGKECAATPLRWVLQSVRPIPSLLWQ